jgi:hypothetical protein
MHLHLPHPTSLDLLPSPTNKWSTTTHPIIGDIFGIIESTISCQNFYFYQGRVLHTKAFATSTIVTTLGNGGKPKGSTKLADASGHNSTMTKEEYITFAILVLGLCPGLQHSTRRGECSILNMLLDNFVTLTNLVAIYLLDKPTNKSSMAHIVACFPLIMLGADALTPTNVERLLGQNDVVGQHVSGLRGDLAIVCHRLILLTCVAKCG